MAYDLRIGQTLDERFKITDMLGKGGMASVHEAIDCATGLVVAVKVPHLRMESDPGFYSRFQRELRPANPWRVRWRRFQPLAWTALGTAAVMALLCAISFRRAAR